VLEYGDNKKPSFVFDIEILKREVDIGLSKRIQKSPFITKGKYPFSLEEYFTIDDYN